MITKDNLVEKGITLDKYYSVILHHLVKQLKQAERKRLNATNKLMNMNNPQEMESHTTQKYWKTVANVEFYETEIRKYQREIWIIVDLYDIKNKMHQERFSFLKSVDFLNF